MGIGLRDLKELYFGLHGQIDRQTYVLSWLLMFALQGVLLSQLIVAGEGSGAQIFWFLTWALASFVSTVATLILSVKRARDIGWPPMIALAMIIPAFSLVGLALLSVWPGRKGRIRE